MFGYLMVNAILSWESVRSLEIVVDEKHAGKCNGNLWLVSSLYKRDHQISHNSIHVYSIICLCSLHAVKPRIQFGSFTICMQSTFLWFTYFGCTQLTQMIVIFIRFWMSVCNKLYHFAALYVNQNEIYSQDNTDEKNK